MGTKIDSEQGKMEGGYSKHGARVFHRLCEEEKEKKRRVLVFGARDGTAREGFGCVWEAR